MRVDNSTLFTNVVCVHVVMHRYTRELYYYTAIIFSELAFSTGVCIMIRHYIGECTDITSSSKRT